MKTAGAAQAAHAALVGLEFHRRCDPLDHHARLGARRPQRAPEPPVIDLRLLGDERAAENVCAEHRLEFEHLAAIEQLRGHPAPLQRCHEGAGRFELALAESSVQRAVDAQLRVDAAACEQIRDERRIARQRRFAEVAHREVADVLRMRCEHPGPGPRRAAGRFVAVEHRHRRPAFGEFERARKPDQARAGDRDVDHSPV